MLFKRSVGWVVLVATILPLMTSGDAPGQAVIDRYDVKQWNPAEESWDLDQLWILQEPASGEFYRDADGDWVYQSTDDAAEFDEFWVGLWANNLLAIARVEIDKVAGTTVITFETNGDHTGIVEGGTGNSTPVTPANGNGTGVVISGPGTVPPVDTGGVIHVFITDNTVPGDGDDIEDDLDDGWWGGTVTVHEGLGEWGDIIFPLGNEENGSVDVVVISGHGWGGGVACASGGLDIETLTGSAQVIIETRTSPTGVLVFGGCGTADPGNDHGGPGSSGGGGNGLHDLQDLANELGIPVIGNTGAVSDGLNGDGDWIRYDPPTNNN